MAIELIRHKNSVDVVLEYDSEIGPVREININSHSVSLRSKACYVSFSDGFAGVLGTSVGPVLFINCRKYQFSDARWKARIDKEGESNTFTLNEAGKDTVKITYHPFEVDALDPWSEESFDDFYSWVIGKRADSEFFEIWST